MPSFNNTHDIFVSYAHVNNNVTDNYPIDQFIRALTDKVNAEIGRPSPQRVWKDNQLDGNTDITPEIKQQLLHAHCLVLFLSNGYLASYWCQQELEYFYKQHKPLATQRIFYIELDKIAQANKPKALQNSLGYHLWYEDPLSQRTYPLKSDNKAYQHALIDLAKALAKQIQNQQQLQQLIDEAQQASRNNAYDTAIQRWQAVQQLAPQHPQAEKQLAHLQQQQQHQQNSQTLIMRLLNNMQGIETIFTEIAKVLNNTNQHPQANNIIQLSEQYLAKQLDAKTYIIQCQFYLQQQTQSDLPLNYQQLAQRIYEGEMVLFLGSRLKQAQPPFEHQQIAQQLAKKLGYLNFKGTLSTIAEYCELRPDFKRNGLLRETCTPLFENTSHINFYQCLAQIPQPLVLISSVYDATLEQALRQSQKRFAVISTLIQGGKDYDVGHIQVDYSDKTNSSPPQIAEELSSLEILEQGYSLIYKIRGHWEANQTINRTIENRQKDTLLLSERNYFQFARHADKMIPSYVVKQFQGRDLLFLGFNPSSWEDRLLVNALLDKRPYNQTACFNATPSDDPLETAYWNNKHVTHYPLDLAALDTALEELVV